ncbi:MAG: CTP synthetase [Candidatus Woesebacteria bacterium GW2011_GWA2_40_7]|uniref:CTP synthase (glutamine hydrolyzing) n=1 Tax=Candidatus Woesebacteria bacterium GW2011_GWA2_40_7 TaxID=1618562 RepID=A0A0G0VMH2_9BACT|nr:MAG: CTP synthetase [Candidatus Woesebacteria bacterium GW2011_GWA2_40_7]
MKYMKFVFVSGGVLSGLGKGITASALALLLKSRGIKVTLMKCDMYLNIDAGTMNPMEHGEVFVTHDGLETDQDLGHYERFTGLTLNKSNYLTNGQIYKVVLDKERALGYGGICVQPYHHIPPEIIKRWKEAGEKNKADVVIVEFGGTVGEYEGLLFYEAYRRLKMENPSGVCLIHVGYLPAPNHIGELKSKPMQQSIINLNSLGVQPDFIVGRAENNIDLKRKEKIAFIAGLPIENIISNPNLSSVYLLPDKLEKEKLAEKVIKKLRLGTGKLNLSKWHALIKKIEKANKETNIAIVGKYQKTGDYILEDTYVSVIEALKHAGFELGIKPKITWIDSEDFDYKELKNFDGIIVPQGWGKRGVEGKIKAVKFARVNKIPYLGLCFGMQMAVIEFARTVLAMKDANTTEADPKTNCPVIHVMNNQKEYLLNKQYGGTIRLGAWPCKLTGGTILEKDNKFKEEFEKNGFIISGTSPDGTLVEAIELENHPFFVGTQFHPEYISRPLSPHPIFLAFVKACKK